MNNKYKKAKKILSILCVILLLSTLFASTITAQKLNLSDKVDELTTTIIQKEGEEVTILEKTKDIVDTLKNEKTSIKNYLSGFRTNVVKSLTTVASLLRNSRSGLMFYTNYNGVEKETNLKLFTTQKIDANNDGKNDISVKYSVYPSFIIAEMSFTFNVKLNIKKLADFPDSSSAFQAFAEFYFPGMIVSSVKGDRVQFGYNSPIGETVPSSCDVVYKLIPHLMRPNKKAGHQISIDPGDIKGSSDLDLLYGYTNFNGDTVSSENLFRVEYSPAISSEISIGGTKIGAGADWEFEKITSESSDVNIYFSHYNNGSYTYLYCLDVPNHLKFSIEHGKNGYVEFDSYGDNIGEVGFTDSFTDPVNYVYVKNFPSLVRFDWTRNLITLNGFSISAYAEGSGIELGGHLKSKTNANASIEFTAISQGTLNCSIDLDITSGYLKINRTGSDMSIDISATGKNNGEFDASMNYKRKIDGAFELDFKNLLDDSTQSDFGMRGEEFEISDLELRLNSSIIKGEGFIKMDRFYKEQNGSIDFACIVDLFPNGINITFIIDIKNGWNVTNLSIGYNSLVANLGSFDFGGDRTIVKSFCLNGTVDYDFASDFSWGYINIYGALLFTVNRGLEKNGRFGGCIGQFELSTPTEGFNLSWYTNATTGKRVFNIDGGGVVSIHNFHLWFDDIIDFTISSFNGSIILEEANQDSGNLSLDINSEGAFGEFVGFNFSTSDIIPDSNIEFYIQMENTSFSSLFDVEVEFSWKDGKAKQLVIDAAINTNLYMENFRVGFKSDEGNFNLNSSKFALTGEIILDYNFTFPLEIDGFYLYSPISIALTDATIDAYIDDLDISEDIDLDDIAIVADAVGTVSIGFDNIRIKKVLELFGMNFEEYNFTHINITFKIDTTYGDLNLKHFEIGNIGPIVEMIFDTDIPVIRIIIENLEFKNGKSYITIPILLQYDIFMPWGLGIKFNNTFTQEDGDYTMTLEKMTIRLPEMTLGNVTQMLGLDFDFGEYAEVPLELFIENASFVQGHFGIYMEMLWQDFKIEFYNGSALNHVEIRGGFEGLAFFIVTLDEKFDYLLADINGGTNEEGIEYIKIDTHNSTITIDLEITLKKDFLNLMTEIFAEEFGIELAPANDDISLLLEEIKFKADGFMITNYSQLTTNPSSVIIEGSLYIELGSIWLYVGGSWEQIGGGEISFLIEEGHAKLYIDEYLSIPGYSNVVPDTGTEIYLAGEFEADELTIEIFWDTKNGSIGFEFFADFDVKIQNFEFRLINVSDQFKFVDLSLKSLTLDLDAEGIFLLYLDGENKETWLDMAASLKEFSMTDLNLTVLVQLEQPIDLPGDGPPLIVKYDVAIDGKLDLNISGNLKLKTDFNNTWFGELDSGSFTLSNFSFRYKKGLLRADTDEPLLIEKDLVTIEGDEITIEGSGVFEFVSDEKMIDVSITALKLINCHIMISQEFMGEIIGGMHLSIEGDLNIVGAAKILYHEQSYPDRETETEFQIIAGGYIGLSSFRIVYYHVQSENDPDDDEDDLIVLIEFTGGTASITGIGAFITTNTYWYFEVNLESIKLSGCHIQMPDVLGFPEKNHTHFRLNLDIDLEAALNVKWFHGTYDQQRIEFKGTLIIENVEIEITQYNHLTPTGYCLITCNYLKLKGTAVGNHMTIRGVNQNTGTQFTSDFLSIEIEIDYFLIDELRIRAGTFTLQDFKITGEMLVDVDASAYISYQKSFAPAPDPDSPPGNTETWVIAGVLRNGEITVNNLDIKNGETRYKATKIYVGGKGSFRLKQTDGIVDYVQVGTSHNGTNYPAVIDLDVIGLEIDTVSFQKITISNLNLDVDSQLSLYIQAGRNPTDPDSTILDNLVVELSLGAGGKIDLDFTGTIFNVDISIIGLSLEGSGTFDLSILNAYLSPNPSITIDLDFNLALSLTSLQFLGFTVEGFVMIAGGHLYLSPIIEGDITYPFDPSTIKGVTIGFNGSLDFSVLKFNNWDKWPDLILWKGYCELTFIWDDFDASNGLNFEVSGFAKAGTSLKLSEFESPAGLFSAQLLEFDQDTSFSLSFLSDELLDNNGFLTIEGYVSHGEVSLLDINFEVNSFELVTVSIGSLNFDSSGTFTIHVSANPDWAHANFIYENSFLIPPDIDALEILIGGKSIVAFGGLQYQGNRITIDIDIDALSGNPDYNGSVGIDTNNQPLTIGYLELFDFFRIKSGLSFTADKFRFSWDWDFSDGWIIPISWQGKITRNSGSADIEIYINDKWVPILMNAEEEGLIACFSYYPYYPEIDDTITFDATCSSPNEGNIIDHIRWDFNADQSGWDIDWVPFEDYGILNDIILNAAGIYDVTIEIRDNELNVANCTHQIEVFDPNQPVPKFKANPTTTYPDTPIEFDASESHAAEDTNYIIELYEWDFGDGTTDTGMIVSHSYDEIDNFPASYTVSLTVTDNATPSNSITLTKENYITILDPTATYPPVASFSWWPEIPFEGETISFDASASYDPDGGSLSYSWEFGDESTGTGENPSHLYSVDGVYLVNLTVTDEEDTTDTVSHEITVYNQDPANTMPDVYLHCKEYRGSGWFDIGSTSANGIITLNGDSANLYKFSPYDRFSNDDTNDPEGFLRQYKWSIEGEGINPDYNNIWKTLVDGDDEDNDPDDEIPDSVELFGYIGEDNWQAGNTYSVTLTVMDEQGGVSSATINMQIHGPPTLTDPDVDPDVGTPSEDYTYTVTYTDPDGDAPTIHRLYIDGGDQWTDNVNKISGSYKTGAVYQATNPDDLSDGMHNFYFVFNDGSHDDVTTSTQNGPNVGSNPPTAVASIPAGGDAGESLTFDGSQSTDSDGYIVSYEWNFGDGYTGSGQTKTHSYQDAGTYTVTLTVEDNEGLTNTDTETISIRGPPVAVITGPSSGQKNQQLNYDGSSSYDTDENGQHITWYKWWKHTGVSWVLVGSGSSMTSVTISFITKGQKGIKLEVTDDEGKTGTITKDITIN